MLQPKSLFFMQFFDFSCVCLFCSCRTFSHGAIHHTYEHIHCAYVSGLIWKMLELKKHKKLFTKCNCSRTVWIGIHKWWQMVLWIILRVGFTFVWCSNTSEQLHFIWWHGIFTPSQNFFIFVLFMFHCCRGFLFHLIRFANWERYVIERMFFLFFYLFERNVHSAIYVYV